MKKLIIALTFSGIGVTTSKKSKNSTGMIDCSGIAKSFATDVNPVLQSYCVAGSACHVSGNSNGPGSLISYQHVHNARSSIHTAILSGSMPQNGGLSSSQKTQSYAGLITALSITKRFRVPVLIIGTFTLFTGTILI